jgi:hypothetical protein
VIVTLTVVVSEKGSDAGVVLRRLGSGIGTENDAIGQVLVFQRARVRITIAGLVQSVLAGPLDKVRFLVVLRVEVAVAELG